MPTTALHAAKSCRRRVPWAACKRVIARWRTWLAQTPVYAFYGVAWPCFKSGWTLLQQISEGTQNMAAILHTLWQHKELHHV